MPFSPSSIMISHETIKGRKKIIPFFILFSLVIRKENLFQRLSHPRPPLNLISHKLVTWPTGCVFSLDRLAMTNHNPTLKQRAGSAILSLLLPRITEQNSHSGWVRLCHGGLEQHLWFLLVICLVQDDKGSLLMVIPLGVRVMEAPSKAWAF